MNKEEWIVQRVQYVLGMRNLHKEREWVERIVSELGIEVTDLASALLHIQLLGEEEQKPTEHNKKIERLLASVGSKPKMIRYKLAVGMKHGVTREEIEDVLVEESGVERKLIHFVEMTHWSTVVELPEGMPEDIFRHLKTTEIKQHPLDIKRVNGYPKKKQSRRRKKRFVSVKNNKQLSLS
ncbi:MAG: hypothetical protein Kow0065_00340 [Methylomicrobium sp.]